MVQEAVDRLNAEKAAIEQQSESWRQQAITTKKAKDEAEQRLELARIEAAKLRKTIAEEAKTLANTEVMRIKAQIVNLEAEKNEIDAKLKAERKSKTADVDRLVNNKLKEQQNILDTKEAQIVSIEKRIEVLRTQLNPLESKHSDAVHHSEKIKEADRLLNSLALVFMDAFDPDFSKNVPSNLADSWKRCAARMHQAADDLVRYINESANIYSIEVDINEQ